MQFLYSFPRFRPNFVLDGQGAEDAPVRDDEEHRFTLGTPCRSSFSYL
jgi:hypothetical protein